MTGKTHALAGGLAGALALSFSQVCLTLLTADKLLVIPLSVIGALIPDCDLPKSTAGKVLGPISTLINKCFGHRTVTHSLTFWGILSLIMIRASPESIGFVFAFGIGVLSHLILDLFNRTGEALLWPVSKKISVAAVPLCGIVEQGIRFVCACGILYFVVRQGIIWIERSWSF